MSSKYGWLAAGVVMITGVFAAPIRPSLAADTVVLKTGETELLTVPVSELTSFVQTGTAPESLAAFTSLVNETEKAAVRDVLKDPIQVKPAPFNQFLQTNLGNLILTGLGDVFKPDGSNQTPAESLRQALTTAAADGSFTMVDLVKSYPTANMIIDVKPVLTMVKEGKSLGSDVKLLLAAFGVEVDTSDLKFDLNSLRTLFDATKNYAKEVDGFVSSTGLTVAELTGPTPPAGTIQIQKADLYRLVQNLEKLVKEAEASTGVVIK